MKIRELKLLKECIMKVIPHNSKYQILFLCAFSNILKTTSRWLTKSIKPQIDPNKNPMPVMLAFEKQCDLMRSILTERKSIGRDSKSVIECRDVLTIQKESFVDLIVSSPPYVTSYEYADLHQLSALWLDYASDYRELRKKSIGSRYHHKGVGEYLPNLNCSGRLIVDELVKKDRAKACSVAKYYIDMQKVTSVCKNMLTPGGMLLMVIGNTEYKGVQIDNVKHLCESMFNSNFNRILVTKRKISGKILTPYRDEKGRFSASQNKKKVYSEEFIVIGR